MYNLRIWSPWNLQRSVSPRNTYVFHFLTSFQKRPSRLFASFTPSPLKPHDGKRQRLAPQRDRYRARKTTQQKEEDDAPRESHG